MAILSTPLVWIPEMGEYISVAQVSLSLQQSTSASSAWPSANLALFVPFRVSAPCVAYKMSTGFGTTASGNYDLGIYDAFGNRLVSTGTQAKGASVEAILDITDTELGPGLYYMAQSADGTNNYWMWLPNGT